MIDNVDDAWAFVCSLYDIVENDAKGIDDARQNNCESVTWPIGYSATNNAFVKHITRANYQAKIWQTM